MELVVGRHRNTEWGVNQYYIDFWIFLSNKDHVQHSSTIVYRTQEFYVETLLGEKHIKFPQSIL